jgi:RNA polymerase sigma factor (sigma-70 family)
MGATSKLAIEQDEAPMTLHEQVAQIYEQSREEIYRYIVMMGIPREQAQEICQEAFLRLYTVMSQGQQIENLRAWAFTVARNQALNSVTLDCIRSLRHALQRLHRTQARDLHPRRGLRLPQRAPTAWIRRRRSKATPS